MRDTKVAAQALGVQLQLLEVRSLAEFESSFSAMHKEGVGALLVLPDTLLLERHRRTLTALALKHRLAAMYPWRMYVEAGGLLRSGRVARLKLRTCG